MTAAMSDRKVGPVTTPFPTKMFVFTLMPRSSFKVKVRNGYSS